MSPPDLGPRYEFLRRLGAGGVGEVVLVRDSYLKKELALKLLHPSVNDEGELEQLQKEFALLSQIEHPGIARAYDFGYLPSGLRKRPYFTREFIPGEPLSQNGAPFDLPRFLSEAGDITEAVAFLHRGSILHLDIKPSNIIVSTKGRNCPGGGSEERRRAILIDFGLFRRGAPARGGVKIKGSLPYMAPECFRREAIGPWTDIYALGVTFYRLTTGSFPRRPPSSSNDNLAGPILDPAPKPPSDLCPSVPRDLDEVILKCLALDPSSRFSSAVELHDAFNVLARQSSSQQAPSGRGQKASSRAATSPLPEPLTVGRDVELLKAKGFLESISPGKAPGALSADPPPATLLISGPRGMGQTHLFREIKVQAQTRGLSFYLETGYPGRPGPPGSLLACLSAHVSKEGRPRWEAFLSRLRKPRKVVLDDAVEKERSIRWAGEIALAAGTIRDPLVVAADGLQLFDEVSVTLLIDLVRFLGDGKPLDRPPILVVVGYREEGPSARLLSDLTEYLLEPGKGWAISLGPLGLVESLQLYGQRKGGLSEEEAEGTRGLGIYQKTGGSPARIAALATAGDRGVESEANHPRERVVHAKASSLQKDDRCLLLTLALLERPVSTSELARFTGMTRQRLRRLIVRLRGASLILEAGSRSGEEWLAGPEAGGVLSQAPARERRRIHAQIARELTKSIARANDGGLVEVVHHFRRAGNSKAVVRYGLRVAHYLKSTLQVRAALSVLRDVIAALPPHRPAARIRATLEIAELQARAGDLDDGIRLLGEVMTSSSKLPRAWQARVLLRLATLHTRRGDFRRADGLFCEGMKRAGGKNTILEKDEFLFFLNEHAAMNVFAGNCPRALELCEEGLRLAGRSRSFRLREVALNLHATRGNVALRTFQFEEAVQSFETALDVAEMIGSPANEAIILNNLGVVHSQSGRYEDAIRTFREAEEACLRLDEGPSLSFINGNLAVLYGKTGDFKAMERALEAAEKMGGSGAGGAKIGRRQELFLEHHRGLSLLYRGRPADARRHLEAAIRLGGAIGDPLIVAFDEIYRAEALLFEGAYPEAIRDLRRLSEANNPGSLLRMALSRLSFLFALTAQEKEMTKAMTEYAKVQPEREIPFLKAWDDLFLGWSHSISGGRDAAQPLLGGAESYFLQRGLQPAASLAAWVKAEANFLQGDHARAREHLEGAPDSGSDLTAVLLPLLKARLCLESGSGAAERAHAADLLSQAGAALVGNPLTEWALRLAAIRAALQAQGRKALRKSLEEVEKRRQELTSQLPQEARKAYLQSPYWKKWTQGLEGAQTSGPRSSPPLATQGQLKEPSSSTKTVALRVQGGGSLRECLVARSPGMRRVTSILDRIRDSDLPVVISGETGSGKEMIARIIHAESRRFAGPFLVIDFATLPAPLLDVELFGARAGAFTDLKRDRAGILTQAEGGTVLIDEIAGAPQEMQARLLRVLSAATIRPVGSELETKIDVRFLFTTSRDLAAEAREGRFRADLLHRIGVLSVPVPPLRERPEDLPELADIFFHEGKDSATGQERPLFEAEALARLRARPWPGNVRELKNLIQRLRLEDRHKITASDIDRGLPWEGGPAQGGSTPFSASLLVQDSLSNLKDRLERDYIHYHLSRLHGDTQAVSRFLGVTRKHFYRRSKQLGIRLRK